LLSEHDPENIENVKFYNCDYDNSPPPGHVCFMNISSDAFGGCTKENNYGYDSGSPCVFLKLNTEPEWVPEFYNDTSELPLEMPIELKEFISTTEENNPIDVCFTFFLNFRFNQ
jgi:sodium/potassium-transporting ATPase subunit beta